MGYLIIKGLIKKVIKKMAKIVKIRLERDMYTDTQKIHLLHLTYNDGSKKIEYVDLNAIIEVA